MLSSWINVVGIILTTTGTILTLWTILMMDKKKAGTWGEFEERHIEFPKEQRKVRIGCVGIAIGGLLQIIGQFV